MVMIYYMVFAGFVVHGTGVRMDQVFFPLSSNCRKIVLRGFSVRTFLVSIGLWALHLGLSFCCQMQV